MARRAPFSSRFSFRPFGLGLPVSGILALVTAGLVFAGVFLARGVTG